MHTRADGSHRRTRALDRRLKVLYLAPASPRAESLAAQSFIEEEIRGIRAWNVKPYILTDEIRGRTTRDGIEVIGLGRLASVTAAARFGAFVARRPSAVAKYCAASWKPLLLAHALRLEHAAATLVVHEGVEIVHSHFGWPAGFGGSLAAAGTGVPLVASMRGTDVLVRSDLNYGLRLDRGYDTALRQVLFPTAARILTATAFMRTTTVALGAPPERVVILEKGVDTTRFQPPIDRGHAKRLVGLNGPVALAVGSLKRRKGFDHLIDAFAVLHRDDWTLVICGTGEEQSSLEARASAAGVGDRVRFAGHVSRADMPAYFAAADIFVHAAALEAAGNVVLEALASGCAVVCTDSGGPTEYVEDGCNGFVVPVGDIRTLSSRLADLLRNVGLRQRFAVEGRRRIEASHGYDRMMSGLRTIYEEVLVEAGSARFN